MSAQDESLIDQAEQIFADFVSGPEGGDQSAFDRLCATHPKLEKYLRVLRDDLSVIGRLLGEGDQGSGLLDRLRGQSLADSDDDVQHIFNQFLVDGGEVDSDAFRDLLARRPEHAAGLRALADGWLEVEAGFSKASAGGREMHLGSTLFLRHASEPPPVKQEFDADELLQRLLTADPKEPRYRTQKTIGAGGMGEVTRVWDRTLLRQLAMKKIRADRGTGNVSDLKSVDPNVARFMEEAQITSQLNHPGIVPIHDLGVNENNEVFFTMQLVKGRDMEKVYKDVWANTAGWNMTRAVGVLQRVCEAVGYAHDKGVLHRDLKPANVMVGRFGETYVMDWGLARLQDEAPQSAASKTQETESMSIIDTDRQSSKRSGSVGLYSIDGQVKGTPSYMPVEQARGELSTLGPTADVYAVGAMLYHLLAQRAPYTTPGERQTPWDILDRVKAGSPEPVGSLAPKTPAELVAITERAMARDAGSRYQSMSELGDDLRAYLENRVVQAYRTGPFAEFQKWTVRNRGTAVSLGGGLVMALGGLSFTAAEKTVQAAEARNETRVVKQEKQEVEEQKEVVTEERDEAVRLKRELEEAVGTIDKQRAELELLGTRKREAEAALKTTADQLSLSTEELDKKKAALADREAQLQQAVTREQEALATARAAEERIESLAADTVEAQAAASQAKLARADAEVALASAEQQLAPVRDYRALDLLEFEAQDAWPITPELAGRFTAWLQRAETLLGGLDSHRDRLAAGTVDAKHAEVLIELVPRLEAFGAPGGVLDQVRGRVAQAETLLQTSVVDQKEAWDQALASIADPSATPAYDGLRIDAIPGLVPLGLNKQGLYEFGHVITGEPAFEGLGEGSGLVFVLLPGGRFDMGSVAPVKNKIYKGDPNVADDSSPFEAPINSVLLEPFLISKYEVSISQWNRWPGRRGEMLGGDPLEPASEISWYDAEQACWRVGLDLPTEAQWEYAARSGNGAPWWPVPRGATDSLNGYLEDAVNLADRTLHGAMPEWDGNYEQKIQDGYPGVAPVTAFGPNHFGLYTILGNVAEWCLDGRSSYEQGTQGPAALRGEPASSPVRMVRGGHYQSTANRVRAAYRASYAPGDTRPTVGFRPVLRLR